jgi:hypothetical protein
VKVYIAALTALTILLSSASSVSQARPAEKPAAHAASDPFVGRWDLTLKASDREYPSWLEISKENGQYTAQMVGRWGSARSLPKIEIANGNLTFVSPKEEEGSKQDLVFHGAFEGKALSGTLNGPDGTPWTWAGERVPELRRTSTPEWGDPVPLFNGKDLTGWKMSTPGPPVWTVQDGTLVTPGNGPELISDLPVQDFKLHIEFNCGKESNSGIYLRGRYEVQLETDSEAEPPSHHTGGVYGFVQAYPEFPRKPDVWQTFDITLIGRRITVVQNGYTIINNKEIPGITGGALNSQEALPAPIYLQGSEKGHVAFRNIILTPAK